jgi:hypothetical protein
MIEDDVKSALAARPRLEPAPGFEARTAAGVHARWRRPDLRLRLDRSLLHPHPRSRARYAITLTLGLAAAAACVVFARGMHPAGRTHSPAAQVATVYDVGPLVDDLLAFSSLERALEPRADWDRALAPLAPYRALAELGELP